jgi:hypothetical protein
MRSSSLLERPRPMRKRARSDRGDVLCCERNREAVMRTVDRILLQAKLLSPEEKRELLEKLQQEIHEPQPSAPALSSAARRAIAYFVEEPRWTPPPQSPSVVDLLREDRER